MARSAAKTRRNAQKKCDSTQGLVTLVEEHPSWWCGTGADGFGPLGDWL